MKLTTFRNLVFGLAALTAGSANAGVILYSTAGAWSAAVAGLTTTNVDMSNAPGVFASSFTATGVTFTGNPWIIGANNSNNFDYPNAYLFGYGQVSMSISASSNVYGIAFNWGCSSNCGYFAQNLTVTTGAGQQTLVDIPYPTYNWTQGINGTYYLFSTSPITQVTLSGTSTQPNIALDGIQLASGVASGGGGGNTPEGATMVLMGTGLLALAALRKAQISRTA